MRNEMVAWLGAGLCVVLGVAVAPFAGGSLFVPLAIGIALGLMVLDMRRRREADNLSGMP